MSALGQRLLTPGESKMILHMWQDGVSMRQLARQFAVSTGTIKNTIDREGGTRLAAREGRGHAKGSYLPPGCFGMESVRRIVWLCMTVEEVAEGAGVDLYQVDQIYAMAKLGRSWQPPPKVASRLASFLWRDG